MPLTLLETFFRPANFFVWHPERAALVATAIIALYFVIWKIRGRRVFSLLIAGLAWGVFALWEVVATVQRWDIRVDLLMLWPLLVLLSGAAAVSALFGFRRHFLSHG